MDWRLEEKINVIILHLMSVNNTTTVSNSNSQKIESSNCNHVDHVYLMLKTEVTFASIAAE